MPNLLSFQWPDLYWVLDYGWSGLSYAGVSLAVIALLLVVIAGWASTLVGLPGNWITALATMVYGLFTPDTWRIDIGWQWVVALFVLATLGEILEFAASAFGTQRAGGSRRSAVLALVGSMVGGIVGIAVTLPIPLLGPLIGAVVLGGVGAAIGAFLGELSKGTDANKTVKVSWGAFWGRLLGTGAKTLVGGVMVAAVVVALMV